MANKRNARIKREVKRNGGPHQGQGWAARRASKRVNRRGKKRTVRYAPPD